MKKLAFAFAALALATGSVFAQGYVGAAIGQSHVDVDCGPASCDNTGTGYKLFGGYKFSPNLGAELTYFDWGKSTATFGSATGEIRGTGVGLGVAFGGDFAAQWSGVARLGIASNRAKTSGPLFVAASESKAQLYAGLGVSYAVSKELKVDLAADFSKLELMGEKGNVRLLSVGVTYGF